MNSVAVIGAGMAGITCASKLALSVPEVKVFEKYAYAGGRMASVNFGDFYCDLGAQYFTARDDDFIEHLHTWEQDWLIDLWHGWLVELENGQALTRDDVVKRYVGRPGMDSVVKHLAKMCDVSYNTEIVELKRINGQWQLLDSRGQTHGTFDAVISALPAPQSKNLLSASLKLAKKISKVDMQAAWVLMLGFDESINMGFDAANLIDSPITWFANNASKPGRGRLENQNAKEVWLVQVGNEWSNINQHVSPEHVIQVMTKEFKRVTGHNLGEPSFKQAYLWKNAITTTPLGQDYLFHEKLNIGACGDWCKYGRVEGAFISGKAMAEHILATIEGSA